MLTPQYLEGVETDCCARCLGVWLEGGEFDKLMDRLSAYKGNAVGRGEPVMQQGQYGSTPLRRRRSFLAVD